MGAGAEPAVGDGDDHQGDEEPDPVANSTSDDERDAKHASVPLRRVRAGEARWEKFLYELKAGLRAAASLRTRLKWPSTSP